MEIKGKLIQVLPLQTGEGKNGTWKKQDVIIETAHSQYPKKVCISIWGDKINENLLKVGNELDISFDIESREYNGRWYTDVKAWKIDASGTAQAPDNFPEIMPEVDFEPNNDSPEDDLPF